MNWIKLNTAHQPQFVIIRINTRKDELIGKLRITDSIWEVDEEYFEYLMNILSELNLNFSLWQQ